MTLTTPERQGLRPRTYYGIAHHQLDQTPSRELYARLVERFLAIPDTTNGPEPHLRAGCESVVRRVRRAAQCRRLPSRSGVRARIHLRTCCSEPATRSTSPRVPFTCRRTPADNELEFEATLTTGLESSDMFEALYRVMRDYQGFAQFARASM